MNTLNDSIELLLPFKAQYVSIARLTASGIAARVGFDIDTVEDIKVAVAEVCNKLVTRGSDSADNYRIVFHIDGDFLKIVFDSEDKTLKCIFNEEYGELGLSIMSALMDDVVFCTEDSYLLSMTKKV